MSRVAAMISSWKQLFTCRRRCGAARSMLLAVFLTLMGTGLAVADWINLTAAEKLPNIAEIFVREDRVHIVLQLSEDSLENVAELLPENMLNERGIEPEPIEQRMERFAREKLQVIADGTIDLSATLRFSEPRPRKDRSSPVKGIVHPLTRQKAPEPPDEVRVLHAELDYFFDQKPKTLTFVPPLDADGNPLLELGFIVYQESVPVIDFRELIGPATLTINWDDPWVSAFENPNLARHHRWPIMSFIYVEPREVRHEIVIRLRDLEDWTNLGLDRNAPITDGGRKNVLDATSRFFEDKNPVIIDGAPVNPASVRTDFLDLSLAGIEVIEDDRNLDPATAVLGVTLSYPVGQMPEEVTTIWQLFSDRIETVPVTSIDPIGPFPAEFGVTYPSHTWTNRLLRFEEPGVNTVPVTDERSLKLPLLTIVLAVFALNAVAFALKASRWAKGIGFAAALIFAAGAAVTTDRFIATLPNPFATLPGENEAETAIKSVFANANASFYEINENQLEAELSKFVHQGLAPIVFTELERANRVELPGGITARVGDINDVAISEIRPLDAGRGFSALARWSAEAVGQHWGYLHLRELDLQARVEMIEDDRVWRLAGLTDLSIEIRE
ncbi:hypothetical protein [Roseibium sp.]|uniref:hypothetical protein n=1 Tax=Roseibium sp. TaxID=1936156 RepID=UPI003BAAEB85